MIVTIIPAPPKVSPTEHITTLCADLLTHATTADLAYSLGFPHFAEKVLGRYHAIAEEILALTGTDPRPAV